MEPGGFRWRPWRPRGTLSYAPFCAAGMGRLRFISSRNCTELDQNPVPAVDCDDGHGQGNQLPFGKLLPDLLIDGIRRVRLAD